MPMKIKPLHRLLFCWRGPVFPLLGQGVTGQPISPQCLPSVTLDSQYQEHLTRGELEKFLRELDPETQYGIKKKIKQLPNHAKK